MLWRLICICWKIYLFHLFFHFFFSVGGGGEREGFFPKSGSAFNKMMRIEYNIMNYVSDSTLVYLKNRWYMRFLGEQLNFRPLIYHFFEKWDEERLCVPSCEIVRKNIFSINNSEDFLKKLPIFCTFYFYFFALVFFLHTTIMKIFENFCRILFYEKK